MTTGCHFLSTCPPSSSAQDKSFSWSCLRKDIIPRFSSLGVGVGVGGNLGTTILENPPYGAEWGMVTSDIRETEEAIHMGPFLWAKEHLEELWYPYSTHVQLKPTLKDRRVRTRRRRRGRKRKTQTSEEHQLACTKTQAHRFGVP